MLILTLTLTLNPNPEPNPHPHPNQEWMTEMLGRLAADRALEEEALVHEAQTIFSCCFHEVIRQVAVHCAERGHLMAQIWISNMELFERLSQLVCQAGLEPQTSTPRAGLPLTRVSLALHS